MVESQLKIEEMSWWRKRPRTEKCLIVVIGVLVLLVVIVLSVNTFGATGGCKQDGHPICLTNQCVKTAARVLNLIDSKVDPCEDFYRFACGNFIKNTIIPEDKTSVSTVTLFSEKAFDRMNAAIKTVSDKDIRPFRLLKELYESCMNKQSIETNSLEYIKGIFKDTGGWPILEDRAWNETSSDWISTQRQLMKLGFTASKVVYLDVRVDVTNSTKYQLNLDQVAFSFDKNMRRGFNDTVFDAYYDYMVKVVRVLGVEESRAKAEMRKVAELVIDLARITLPDEERRDLSRENNPMTIRELEGNYTYFPWLDYINGKLNPYKEMQYEDVVKVNVPSYYSQLEEILSSTSKRTLMNYIYWMTMEGSITYLNDELRHLALEYDKTTTGLQEFEPRWKECTKIAIALYVASGAYYVRNFFDRESKEVVGEMVGYIREQFVQTLQSVDWMDQVTKRHAIDKINAIHLHLAYPNELLDDQKLEIYYRNFSFDVSNYLGSMLNLSLMKNELEFPEIGQKFDKTDWKNHAYVTIPAAFYDLNENSIEALAGILQDVYFDASNPKYMNYGAIGYVIGHEITHGFDDKGRQHDKNGNLINWWKSTTKAAFDRKVQCIIQQYGNVTVPDVNMQLNGVNTQGENIADNGGIKLAYNAYRQWTKKHDPEPVLPGLKYSPEQMFWIALANTWCGVERVEHLKLIVENDHHVPNAYRVNVPLMNSESFARDFKCSKGAKMNPIHKCRVW